MARVSIAKKPRVVGMAALTRRLSSWVRRNSSGEFLALVPGFGDGEIGDRIGIRRGQRVLPRLERLGGPQLPEALGNPRHLEIDTLREEDSATHALDG